MNESLSPPARYLPVLGGRLVSVLVAVGCLWLVLEQNGGREEAWDRIVAAEEANEKVDLRDDIQIGLWLAGGIGFFVAVVLLGTAPWWARSHGKTLRVEKKRPPVWFWPGILVAVVLSLWLRAPLAAGSLWWDELWNIKHTTVGYFKPDDSREEGYRFLQRGWDRAFWYYGKPTNHPPYSVLSKLTLEGWRDGAKEEDGAFNEVAARLPAIAAGVLSILFSALLLRAAGMPLAGVLGAFFLALHPWFIRYGIDARAYSLNMMLIPAGVGSLWMALRTMRWRWWIAFGVVQWWIVWALPVGVFYAAGLAGAAMVKGATGTHAVTQRGGETIWRVLAVNGFAAIAFLVCFAPNLLQMRRWGEINDHQFLGWPLLAETVSLLFAGNPIPAPGWIMVLLGLGVVGIGWMALAKRDGYFVVVFLALFLSAVASLIFHWAKPLHFYPRYLIYLLPPAVMLAAAGVERLVSRSRAWRQWTGAGSAAILVVGWFMVSMPSRETLRDHSYTAFREVVTWRSENWPGAMLVCYGLGGRVLPLYAREALHADSAAELEAFVNSADAEGKDLVLVYAYRDFNENHPELGSGFELIDDPDQFQEAARFPGIEPLFEFRVLSRRAR
ncbi:MAG: hypothetical protein AAGJ79_02350 [Verrucomicrobiota bacterium]